ncbi:MAG: ATP-binding protein, partial [Bacillus sp. (in: Bacteria)]|nr:ATP-binding protein [Bacillus sp. (in: firmicutes)]
GDGLQNLIKFVYKNLDSIGIENFNFILPIIHDWNNKSKKGETTKISSLIALEYYQWVIKEDVYFSRNEGVKERLLQTILYGSSEIKTELSNIFDEILLNDWKWPRDPYYDLLEVILKKLGDNIELIDALPEYIIKLANLYWLRFPKNEPFYYDSSIGIEKYFGLKDNHYFPASSFQTPIYWLLQTSRLFFNSFPDGASLS